MYGYNRQELINFIKNQFNKPYMTTLQNEPDLFDGYVGQGISRTVFAFSEYPDIVFKIGIGTDGILGDESAIEEEIWDRAINADVAPFFAETEYLTEIVVLDDSEWDYYGDGEPDSDEEFEEYYATVYIQEKVDCEWENSDLNGTFNSANAYKREIKIMNILEPYPSCEEPFEICLRKYGLAEMIKLLRFIHQYDICDLHSGNWGVKDGDVKIIDYAMSEI